MTTTTESSNAPAHGDLTLPPSPSASTLSKLLARERKVDRVVLANDPNQAARIRELVGRRDTAKRLAIAGKDNDLDTITAELNALRNETGYIVFHLRSIGGSAYNELQYKNPATQDDLKAFRQQSGDPKGMLRYSQKTFPPALLAATCYRIEFADGTSTDGLTLEEANAIFAAPEYSDGDLAALLVGCEAVNSETAALGDLGKD